MLDDRERRALDDVERRLTADDPVFARSFAADAQRLRRGEHPRGARIALTVAAVLGALMLLAGSLLGAAAVAATVWVVWATWRWSEQIDQREPD